MTTKQQIIHAIEALPDEASIEDAVERLHLMLKIERGIAQADAGQTVTQEEARTRIEQALRLPVDERRQLADALDASLNAESDEMDPDVLAAWDVEIQRRIAEIDDGTAETFDGDEVEAEERAHLAALRAAQR